MIGLVCPLSCAQSLWVLQGACGSDKVWFVCSGTVNLSVLAAMRTCRWMYGWCNHWFLPPYRIIK